MSERIEVSSSPRISVVMAIFKEPIEWIRQAIDSILCQTYKDFEFIIINDNPGRIDNREILDEYSRLDSRVIIIENERNIGLTKSLNKGISIAKGEYIARMDADDISLPKRFETQVSFMDSHKSIGVCGTAIRTFGDKHNTVYYPEDNSTIFLFLDNCFAHPTVVMRKDIANLLYDENCIFAQDFDLWYRAFSCGASFYNIQEPLLFYRCNQRQISSNRRIEQDKIAQAIRRKAYDDYSRKHNIGLFMEDVSFSLENILLFFEKTELPDRERSKFLYYLLLSNESSFFPLFVFVIKHKMYHYVRIGNLIRVLYYTLKGDNYKKF